LALTAWPEDNLPTEPIIDLFSYMLRGEAIEMSDLCLEPRTPSGDEFQVLVCELVPLALDPTFCLPPHSTIMVQSMLPSAKYFFPADEVTLSI
jgi:hypothetical protein